MFNHKFVKVLLSLLLITISYGSFAQFDSFFESKTMRVDYFHSGDKTHEYYSIDRCYIEPYWGGSKVNMMDIFNYGTYKFEVIDMVYDSAIYSRTYSTLFSEWQTTDEANKTVRSFSESVVFPCPKHNVRVDFYSRNKSGMWELKFQYELNPKSYFITTERRLEYPNFEVHHSGDPAKCVDIVMLPEGYTADQMDKFRSDCRKFSEYLFSCKPYDKYKNKFNVWGINAPSPESGTDYPGTYTWKKTLLNTSFYTFDSERYLMSTDNRSIRDMAANAPYDQIYIIVNSDHYGGGAIYNHYAVCISDNQHGEYVFTHEFGHSFAGLGDEYYDSETSYIDFYPLNLEPWEPNLTTLVNFDIKWKDMLDPSTPVPTPNDGTNHPVPGVYEGGGYVAKGVYRPAYDCTMKSISEDNFCPVCKRAIVRMIEFYTH
jgi:hypothetical protein